MVHCSVGNNNDFPIDRPSVLMKIDRVPPQGTQTLY